jgi:hypothetical protein
MDLSTDILGLDDLRTKEVKVPAWKRTVTVRELGLQESMLAFGSLKPGDDGEVTLGYTEIAQIVAYGVIDPDTGERVFNDKQVPKLARKNQKALMLLYTSIVSLSGSVEDEVKN